MEVSKGLGEHWVTGVGDQRLEGAQWAFRYSRGCVQLLWVPTAEPETDLATQAITVGDRRF